MRSSRLLDRLAKRFQSAKGSTQCHWLPEELVLSIMLLLASDIYHEHHAAYQYWRSDDEWTEWLKREEMSVRAMFSAILVCRTWYAIGIEVLYANPTFLTKSHLRSFTFAVERSTFLPRLVKSLSIAELYYPRFKTELFGIMGKHRERLLHYVHRALVACPGVTRLDICTDAEFGAMIADLLSQTLASFSARLRHLTIRGVCFHCTFGKLTLPQLEILAISQHYYLDLLELPSLPRLHTLQIVSSDVQSIDGSLTLDASQLPSLRVLQIFTNDCPGPLFDSPPCFAHLQHIEIFGRDEMFSFDVLSQSITLSCPREVTLGPITQKTPWLSTWRLPASVETVLFFVDLVCEESFQLADSTLSEILDFVVKNFEDADHRRLREFRLALPPSQFDLITGSEGLANVEKIGTHCEKLHIEFDVLPLGSCNLSP